MKIALVSRGWFPSVRGGSEKFITRVAEELYNLGHEVIGITRWCPGIEYPKADYRLIVYEDRRPKQLLSSIKFSRWAAKTVNEVEPDAVLINSYWGEASPLFIKKEIPKISIIHDVGLFKSELAKKQRIKYLLRKFILSRVVNRVDAVIVPTDAVKNDLIKYLRVDPHKVRVLGFEGVDGPFKRVHEENEYFDIVQVGRFAPNKGHYILLKAFKRIISYIPNARLWIVGGKELNPQHQKYLERIKAEADNINKSLSRTAVYIMVDVPSVDHYYRIADVCVAPSVSEEGYGLTVIECFSYGKPVIASKIFLETGVADEDRAYIFPCGDSEKLAELIIHVYRNYEEALSKARKGIGYAKQCSWRKVTKRILEVINTII